MGDERSLAQLSRRTMFGVAAVTMASATLAACSTSEKSSSTTVTLMPDEPKTIATDAYIFGYPLVLMDVTRVAAEKITPVNTFQHAAGLPTSEQHDVVRSNLDTLYSAAWLDVSTEPMVLQVPAVEPGRFWLMQLMDAWTNTVHNPSSVRPQVKPDAAAPPYTYAITGPQWAGSLPEGVTQLSVPTPMVWLVSRIQVNGSDDFPVVQAIQQQLKLVRLADWIEGKAAPPSATMPTRESANPPKQVVEMDASTFFKRLCAVMAVNPPRAEDQLAMNRFAAIGIRPGGSVTGISAEDLTVAADRAKQVIPASADPSAVNQNGWVFDRDIGTYGTNYMLRANVAWHGLGANLPEDAIYPTLFGSADLNGVPANFRLHFPPGQLPPVEAFWSLTAYGADGFLVPNPANIYAIGHQVPVAYNADGSVDLAIQHRDPGARVPTGNWLPIPEAGQFSLTMRLYVPKPIALDGQWKPPVLNVAP
ncbi:DUF1254 domain-containing protein [Nocardia sp. NBC_01009]|uniref:DUF1254 domain-containing protein n=1 Tax=Nocardia sp. NBC_01009 TaxID=2975996 RepID=UPI00386B06BB|nr:DUF1254 domain-containing protein [Nocardia sp. NBC_01009]